MNQRMLVVNDIPGAGKVAGNINLPIISSAGIETLILPTLVLSTHTGGDYDRIIRRYMDDSFKGMLMHWQANAIYFDSFLTGYFANPQQVFDFKAYLTNNYVPNKSMNLVVDPIMADGGEYYDGFDQKICGAFQSLLPYCDILLPNITEACLLTQTTYKEYFTSDELLSMCLELQSQGAKQIVITGVRLKESQDMIGFFLVNEDFPQGSYILHKYYPQPYFGTGDIVASIVSASLHHNKELSTTLTFIGTFIEKTIESTMILNRPIKMGLNFEQHHHLIQEFFNTEVL